MPGHEISTHAPRAGSDAARSGVYCAIVNFNPRSPCGERLGLEQGLPRHEQISTHAPRAGSDCPVTKALTISLDFNPRSPCGERPL